MLFNNVSLLSVGYVLPPQVVTSEDIESQLEQVYHRLKLPQGRLEGMSGIRERRLWNRGTRISDMSALSCRRALEASQVDASQVRCLIHASVCREYLEPATACRVHHLVGLPENAWVYDVSNACLGVMNGAVQIAQLIESGVIRAGLVVGTEDCRGLLEATLQQLNSDPSLTRQSIKPAFASLTIGSGSCAWLLGDRRYFDSHSPARGAPLRGAVAIARTQHHQLCQSDTDQAGSGMLPTMNTDSELLLEAGVATGASAFESLLNELNWQRGEVSSTVCHQVGSAHRRRMLEAIGMPIEADFCTFDRLGNTGSVALPTALGIGLANSFFPPQSKAALLGIGSGLNSVMMGIEFGEIAVSCQENLN
jgi:3-oxoacyl-[acyl-carrier-protein] synthase III